MTAPKVAIPSTEPSGLAGAVARSVSPFWVPSMLARAAPLNRHPSTRPMARAIRFNMSLTSNRLISPRTEAG